MELYEREFFVARVDAGYVRYKASDGVLKIYAPDKDVLYESYEIFMEVREDCLMEGLITSEDVKWILMEEGLWGEIQEEELRKANKNVEELKIQLYEAAFKKTQRKKIAQYLDATRREQLRLTNILHHWDHLTAEGIASFARWQHVIKNSTFKDGSLYDWEGAELTHVMQYFHSCALSEAQIRELAREDPWLSTWSVRKKSGVFFNGNMTLEQKSLVLWSAMYDNIKESSECPPDAIISYDDALDGWLILQRRKREGEQVKSLVEEKTQNSKIANSQEIFIQVDNQDDAEKIDLVNSDYARAVKTARLRQVNREGEVKFQNFGDVKTRVRTEATQLLSSTMKRNG